MIPSLQQTAPRRYVRHAPFVPVVSISSARFEVFKLNRLLALECALLLGLIKPTDAIAPSGNQTHEITFEIFNSAMAALAINDSAINGRGGLKRIVDELDYPAFKALVTFGFRMGLYQRGFEDVGRGRRHATLIKTSFGEEIALKIGSLIDLAMNAKGSSELCQEAMRRPDLTRFMAGIRQAEQSRGLNDMQPNLIRRLGRLS